MRQTILALLILTIIVTPSYALSLFEKLTNKEVVVKSYNQKLLVNRLTDEVNYIWQRPTPVQFFGAAGPDPGEWVRVTDQNIKKMWKDLYDQQRKNTDN